MAKSLVSTRSISKQGHIPAVTGREFTGPKLSATHILSSLAGALVPLVAIDRCVFGIDALR